MMPRSFLVLAAAAFLASPAGAITRCVKPTPYPGCFPSIQAAVDESIPGDVINLSAGVYFENVNIPAGKDGLSIAGAGKLRTVVDPDHPLSGNAFTVGSNFVKIRNLGIRNGQAHGISIIGATGVVIQGVRIVGLRGLSSTGIYGTGSAGLQILNSEIRAVGNSGIDVDGGNIVITGNTVAQVPFGINVHDPGARVTSNRVTGTVNGMGVDSDGAVVSANTIQLATADGLGVSGQNPTVQGNKLIHGEEFQIGCSLACSGGLLSANTSLGSKDFAFSVYADAPGFVVRGNNVSWSNGPAFIISGVEATANTATDSGVFGNHDGPDCFRVGEQTILNRNIATRCAGSGFRIIGINATLTGNASKQAGIDGFTAFDVFATDNALTGNKAFSSNGAGFAVVGALRTTLTGNTAVANRYGFCDDGASTSVGQNSFGIPPSSNVCDVVQ
jgi:parallel beta-helix repeat protein